MAMMMIVALSAAIATVPVLCSSLASRLLPKDIRCSLPAIAKSPKKMATRVDTNDVEIRASVYFMKAILLFFFRYIPRANIPNFAGK